MLCRRFVPKPVYPFQGFPFDLSDGLPLPHEVDDLGFEQADRAFSQSIVIAVADGRRGTPSVRETMAATDGSMPASASLSVYLIDRFWLPRSLWWIKLSAWEGARWQIAWLRASSTKPVVMDVDTRQPTILRAKTSMNETLSAIGPRTMVECDVNHALPARDIGEVVVHWA